MLGVNKVNSTWLITSELADQRELKALFPCVVYTNTTYSNTFYLLPAKRILDVLLLFLLGFQGARLFSS